MTPPPVSPGDFMAAAPRGVSGSSPWASRYASEHKRIWRDHAARAPRTLQQHLGPSEIGVPCDRQVVGKLAALPATNHIVDAWPSTRGTAMHAYAEHAYQGDNERSGLLRWVTEQQVTPHPDHPGTADLYDAVEQCVDDHKFLGKTSMAKIRKGWIRKYKVQLVFYGLGYINLGLPVRRVAILAYPATEASMDAMFVRDLEITSDGFTLLPEIQELVDEVFADIERRKALSKQLLNQQIRFTDVAMSADDDECFFCPFYRPRAGQDSVPGCPGPAAVSHNPY